MPMSKYDPLFGGEKGSAAKAHASMIRTYGKDKGERVFYAKANKNKKRRRKSKEDGMLKAEAQRAFFEGQERRTY